MIGNLIQLLHIGGYSCAIMNKTEVRTFQRRGVTDLYDLLQNDSSFLKGAIIADKVIGKAAAALMILGGVERVYTDVISEPALELFRGSKIKIEYVQKVPFIENRNKTGWCPLELACQKESSANDILPLIQHFLLTLRIKQTA